jgi:hypothetical protein
MGLAWDVFVMFCQQIFPPGQSSGGGSGIGTGAVFPSTLTQRFSGGMISGNIKWETLRGLCTSI